MAGTNQEQGPESLDSVLATVMQLALEYINAEEAAYQAEVTGLSKEERKPLYEMESSTGQALSDACMGDEGIARLAGLVAKYSRDLRNALEGL